MLGRRSRIARCWGPFVSAWLFLFAASVEPLRADSIWLVSKGTAAAANSDTHTEGMSADGRFVILDSRAASLVAGTIDWNEANDAFLWDRTSGQLTLISHALGSPTKTADGPSTPYVISADGAYVAFGSQ